MAEIDSTRCSQTVVFWCPTCGDVWGRLEVPGSSVCTLVRHLCFLHPEGLLAYPPNPRLGLLGDIRVPGSFFPSHFHWWESMGGLLLAHPLLALHELEVHLACSL